MAFCDRLKEEMANQNINAAELSRRTGLSEAIISEYRSGKKEPRGKQSVLISKALNISLDDLWETGFQSVSRSTIDTGSETNEKVPAVQQGLPRNNDTADVIAYEKSVRLLVSLGFVNEGEQLSDRDLSFLSGVLDILDAYFDRRK